MNMPLFESPYDHVKLKIYYNIIDEMENHIVVNEL
jgi:hypothetical protein